MEQKIITFTADQQQLTKTSGITNYASDTISYVKAIFTLGENWTGFDEVRAVFKTPYTCKPAVLDSVGECLVPWEVLMYKGAVRVNLVGSIYTEDEVIDRLTTHSVEALVVDEDVPVCGEASAPLTPSEYEQFVAKVATDANRAEAGATSAETSAGEAEASATASAQSATASANSASQAQTYAQNAQNYAVSAETAKDDAIDAKEDAESAKADAESARDQILGMRATANTLAEGSDATASYSDGVLTLGIPRGNTGAKGDKGDKGDTGATPNLSIGTVETLPPTGSSEVTITGTAENPVLNFKLVKGDTGEVTMAQLAQLLPTDTASGDIASFPDGQDVVGALSVLTTIEPIQSGSGTPSPTNIRPISGHTECVTSVAGVNVWDEEWEAGALNDTTGQPASGQGRIRAKNYIAVKSGAEYYFNTAGYNMFAFVYDENYNVIPNFGGTTNYASVNNGTFTVPSGAKYFKFYTASTYGAVYNNNIAVNIPSTDTEYHKYVAGHTYTTNLGRTVYGGTLDVVSGVLTVTQKYKVLDGSENWQYNATASDCLNVTLALSDAVNLANNQDKVVRVIADKMNGVSAKTATASSTRVSGSIALISDKRLYTSISTSIATTMVEFANWLSQNQTTICYELATPQTYQLTPTEVQTLLGTNNVWTDCGSVNVTYKADTYLWVAKQLGQ